MEMTAKTYFTGKACKRGHISFRLRSTRACLECARLANEKWRNDNPGKLYAAVQSWRIKNRAAVNKWSRDRDKILSFNVNHRMSRAILNAIRDRKAGRKWESIVGYSVVELMRHIERQFHSGMSWGNLGEWHIDHITPKAAFDLATDDGIRACWSLPNLRPLPASENCKKRASITHLI